MALRHRWNRKDDHNATCERCGTHAQKRPSPYGRRWWTEWRLPDGSYVKQLQRRADAALHACERRRSLDD